jgi:uncharacterized protein
MMKSIPKLLAAALLLTVSLQAEAAMQPGKKAPVQDVWQPAETPTGGTPWKLLETTKLNDRKGKDGVIYTKPIFPPEIKALAGKQIKVAGYMMPLDSAADQKRWVMLGYPPGCPFHMHALPNQYIEILSPAGVPTNEMKVHTMTGTLELTGDDESGIFYRLTNARIG